MSHYRTVQGSSGNWTFQLPDSVTLTQNGSTTGLRLDGSANLPTLVFNVSYDRTSWNSPHHALDIKVSGPPSNAVTATDFNGLRGPMTIVFHNDLGVPIQEATGASGSFSIMLTGSGDRPSADFHPSYAHVHAKDANSVVGAVTNLQFPGHTIMATGGVSGPAGNRNLYDRQRWHSPVPVRQGAFHEHRCAGGHESVRDWHREGGTGLRHLLRQCR